MMAREWGGALKDSEDTEFRRLRGIGAIFDNYVTEGDGIRRAAQNRTSVRSINIANATKQAYQFEAVTNEFLGKCP
jgi:chromosome partitioning protein